MAGRLLDIDPELAYEHTQAAVRRGGRIDVVREAAGIAAYRTGRYAEALRELRTVRRLNGSSEHLPIMADAERGLGRPERAVALAATPEADSLDPMSKLELALVVSGARSDLGEHDAALVVLNKIPPQRGDLALRVLAARAAALEAAGRLEEAAALLADVDPDDLERATGNAEPEEEVVVYDVYDDEAEDDELDDSEAADDLDADELDEDEDAPDLDDDLADDEDEDGLDEDADDDEDELDQDEDELDDEDDDLVNAVDNAEGELGAEDDEADLGEARADADEQGDVTDVDQPVTGETSEEERP
ncbi:hypothetical protein [Xylanimonas sp. McL0601]|uniref:hypothetical protein n=1 Tax=Xylanimonas sp. McL0601 TaxID=3414739 RepID=UPI003CF3414D